MKLFDKRPLALILCITVGGFVIFSFSTEIIRLLLLISSALLGFLALLFLKGRKERVMTSIASAALLLSMLLSDLYFEHHFGVKKSFPDEVEIEAVIYDIEYTDYSATVFMESRKIDGKHEKRKIIGYIDKSESLTIDTGSLVSFTATLEDFSDKTRSYYYARGFSATVGEIESVSVNSQNEFSLEAYFSDFREMLTRRMIMQSDYETGTVISALLLGERSFLGGNVSLDFRDSGISHILALSGMHLTILAAGVAFLLTTLGINKKWRVLIIVIITLLYMTLTGFSASIMRAGIMLIIASILFLLSSSHDSLTSLIVSVALIILITPYAIYDLSLWLSAFATFGIIAFSELRLFNKKSKNPTYKILWFLLKSLLASVFAIGATLPFTVIFFDTISPFSPVATLIFSIPVEIIMYLGTFMLIFGDLIPVGPIISQITKGILYLVHLIAKIPGTLSSTRFMSVIAITFLFAAVFFLFLVLYIRHKRTTLAVVLGLYCCVFAVSHVMTVAAKNNDGIIYLSDESADAFIIKSDAEVCLIDSSKQTVGIGYLWLNELSEQNIVKLDKYYLTHYSKKAVKSVETVISRLRTSELCLPAPQNEFENNILNELIYLSDRYDINITLKELDEETAIGDFTIRQFFNTPYNEGTSMVGLSIMANDQKYLYISSGMYEGKTKSVTLSEMQDSTAVIFGSHGKKYNESARFDKRFSKIWTIILSSNGFELTKTAREYYELCGGEIYTSPTAIDILK